MVSGVVRCIFCSSQLLICHRFAFAATAVANLGAQEAQPDNATDPNVAPFNPGNALYISLAFGMSLMVNGE